jgi:gamma-glutamylcyclotransferase (GGCT)/AIG2-like uncharacterized protein YtfP
MSNGNYLFVYGTLRRDVDNSMRHLLAPHADFVSKATYQGKLYYLGNYPGAVPSGRSSDIVSGELYALHDHQYLKRLDEYEGSQFRRTQVSVVSENGKQISAWIYLYEGGRNERKVIASGDCLQFRKP